MNAAPLLWAGSCDESLDRRYRYTLGRPVGSGGRLLVVMLNPSTADAFEDDPTIRRVVGFARRDGFGSVEVVNLYALRATDPAGLRTAADPVGPNNDAHIRSALGRCDAVAVAWGADPGPVEGRAGAVLRLIGESFAPLCWGLTKTGQPRHPLYLRGDSPLVPYKEPA